MAVEYKGCLSREQTEKAWNKQKSGTSCVAVAIAFNVDVSTLYRSYQHYGFQPPKYQKKEEAKIMSKDYAKSFYHSAKWQHCKNAFISERRAIDGGLCQRCHKHYGYIVHHKKHITPENISDISIILDHNNLEFLCHDCHNKEHIGDAGLLYQIGEDGQPIAPLSGENDEVARDRLRRFV